MTEPTQGRDVAEFIREQHQEITRLFSAVEAGQGDGRQDAVECLVRLQAVDETAEEEVVRPSVHPHATSRFLPAGWLHRGTRDPPWSIRFAGLLGHAPAVTRRGTVARLTRRGVIPTPGTLMPRTERALRQIHDRSGKRHRKNHPAQTLA